MILFNTQLAFMRQFADWITVKQVVSVCVSAEIADKKLVLDFRSRYAPA